jgi:hypothetical protein
MALDGRYSIINLIKVELKLSQVLKYKDEAGFTCAVPSNSDSLLSSCF